MDRIIPGPGPDVFNIRSMLISDIRLEWHSGACKLYVVRVGAVPEIGELLAEHVETREQAEHVARAYLSGVRYGRSYPAPDLSLSA